MTATVAIGTNATPSTVAAGGVAFDPLAAGSTSVSATIPGYLVIPTATVTVDVTP